MKAVTGLRLCALACLMNYPAVFSQTTADTATALNLDDCITYALKHQPLINQALVNEAITRATNAINTAGWYPQANVSGNLTHYITLPTVFVKNSGTGAVTQQRNGVINTAIPVLTVTQTIFNPALLYAEKYAPLYVKQSEQITDSTKIEIVAAVSKTFYSLLLTLQQINVLKEDTTRLNKNLNDAYYQYMGGIVDETDYDEAAISLNNSRAQLRQATENIRPQYALLKQVMGYPAAQQFNVVYDTLRMQQDIAFDTTQQLQYDRRIELQYLQTARKLQGQVVNYYRKSWLPTLGAFFDYDYEFQNNTFGKLFSNAYPYSFVGLSLSMPLFTGFARTQNLKRANLQYQLYNWDEANLRSQIYAEYTAALASYKSNTYNLGITRENVTLARKTYDIVALQYQQGIVPYLNVITAESNLITAEIGYQNALFQLLSSKIDLQKSMGIITVNH
ncbi:TolC family protein [Deminuibacter soli]|uniref:TolC family protein n=1 Tax=Deminuibacter soli TaxID=2291815 RepID=A0A3E1NCQ6_9BACT|nr:TolC family protein [Deminuibacter soli]RFM25766.1 TolC family protein [Deminuibacter soli]